MAKAIADPTHPVQCWQVYIIEASDSKLYTGITTDMDQRWQQHQSGKGAKFFRGRTPRKLLYLEQHPDRSSASKREAEIKQLTRAQKQQLIEQMPCHPR
jgi:putative endonuclease